MTGSAGRESFVFHSKSFERDVILFNWEDSGLCDAVFTSTINLNKYFPQIDFTKYREWDMSME